MKAIYTFRRFIAISILLGMGFVLAGCATLAKGTKQSVPIRSEPTNAKLVITQNNQVVTDNQTPYMARLDRGAGFFQSANYKIELSEPGYRTETIRVQGELDNWYLIGNFFSWNLIGYVIVDPLSGGMWYLTPDDIRTRLSRRQANTLQNKFEGNRGILVVLDPQKLDQLRPALRSSERVPISD